MKSSHILCLSLAMLVLCASAVEARHLREKVHKKHHKSKVVPQPIALNDEDPRLDAIGAPSNDHFAKVAKAYKQHLKEKTIAENTKPSDLELYPQNYEVISVEDAKRLEKQAVYKKDSEPYYDPSVAKEDSPFSVISGNDDNTPQYAVYKNDQTPYYNPAENEKSVRHPTNLFAVGVDTVDDVSQIGKKQDKGEEQAQQRIFSHPDQLGIDIYKKDSKPYYDPTVLSEHEKKALKLHKEIDQLYDAMEKKYESKTNQAEILSDFSKTSVAHALNSHNQHMAKVHAEQHTKLPKVNSKDSTPYYGGSSK